MRVPNWLAQPDDKPTRRDRAQEAVARRVIYEVQLAALKADGAVALGEHIIHRLNDLDDEAVMRAGNDERKARIAAEIEMEAIMQCKAIQRQLNDPWKLG